MQKEAQEARSRGGKRSYTLDVSKASLNEITNLQELRQFLSEVLVSGRQGKIPPQLVTSLSTACGAMAKILDLGELSTRLEAVERKIDGGR